MNYLIYVLIAGVGIFLGVYFTKQKGCSLIFGQSKKKEENKKKILDFLDKNEKIQNRDVEKLADVSDATATRYLDELEKEGKLKQHGKIGTGVFYTLK